MKFILVLALACFPLTAHAQNNMRIDTGTMTVGGTIEFQNHSKDFPSDQDDQSVKSIKFMPTVGYFIKPYLGIIGTLGYQAESGDTVELNKYFLSGGIRFMQPLAFLHFYLGAEAAFYVTSYEESGNNALDFGVAFPLGVLIPLSKHVALDIGMRFTKLWRDNDHPQELNHHSFIVDIGYFGVQAYF